MARKNERKNERKTEQTDATVCVGGRGEMLRQYACVIQVRARQSHWRNPTTGRNEYEYTQSSLQKLNLILSHLTETGNDGGIRVVDIPTIVLHEKAEARLLVVAALVFCDQERR